MGKSIDERIDELIDSLRKIGKKEQADLLKEGKLETDQIIILAKCLVCGLGQFTRNYTQTTKRGLLTTNKG